MSQHGLQYFLELNTRLLLCLAIISHNLHQCSHVTYQETFYMHELIPHRINQMGKIFLRKKQIQAFTIFGWYSNPIENFHLFKQVDGYTSLTKDV